MVERRISDGSIAYYWRVRAKDRAAGFPIDSEVLGSDYATAVDRANMLKRITTRGDKADMRPRIWI